MVHNLLKSFVSKASLFMIKRCESTLAPQKASSTVSKCVNSESFEPLTDKARDAVLNFVALSLYFQLELLVSFNRIIIRPKINYSVT